MGGLDRLADLSDELADLVGRVVPSIVALSGRGADFSGSGSGFLVDDAGRIVTNAHVVDGFTPPIDVVVHGGEHLRADVVGLDQTTDLALHALDRGAAGGLPALDFRSSPAPLGSLCFGLGRPLRVYPESLSLG